MSESKRSRNRGVTSNKNIYRFAINCYKYGTVTNKDLAQRVETELLAEKAKTRAKKTEELEDNKDVNSETVEVSTANEEVQND